MTSFAVVRWPVTQLVRKFFFAVSVLGTVSSCNLPDPHENYWGLMNANVGSKIDKPFAAGSANPNFLMESRRLPNGNIENKYKYIRSCRTFFEFDPKTRIIVGWRFEGKTSDCVIFP